MRKWIIGISLLASLVGMAACGSDDSSGNRSGADTGLEQDSGPTLDAGDTGQDSTSFPDDISLEAFGEAFSGLYVDLSCTRAWECSAPPQRPIGVAVGRRFDSVQQCRSKLKKAARAQYRPFEGTRRLVEAGRVNFNSQAAAECLDAIASLTVPQICGPKTDAFLNVCDSAPFLEGTIAPGESCIGDVECDNGSCDIQHGSCDGTCVTFSSGGCGDGPACTDDERCARQPGGASSCVALRFEGEPCDKSEECRDDLYCPKTTGHDLCELRKPRGSDCVYQDECLSGYHCVGDLVGRNRVCRRPKSIGEACYSRHDCADDVGCMKLESESTGICADDQSRQQGQSCSRDRYCSWGNKCENETCVKIEYVAQDEECGADSFCTPGTVCRFASPDAATGACRALAQQGDDCAYTNSCAYGFYCSGAAGSQSGSCVPTKADGASCSDSGDCTSGLCQDDICGGAPGQMCPIP